MVWNKKQTRTKIQWRICSIFFDCCNIGLQFSHHLKFVLSDFFEFIREILYILFCFVKHSNKRHISDFKNCCGLFWVSIFAVFISFYQGSIEGRYIWPNLFVFGFSCQSLRPNIRLKMFFLFFIFLYPLFLEFLWYVFRKWQFSVKFT